MFDVKALENDQIYMWNVTKDHETHLKRIDEIISTRKRKIKDPLLIGYIKNMHQAKESSRKMIQTEKNYEINRTNQLLFDKIIEISQGKTNDVKELGKTSMIKKKNTESIAEVEPTLHYFYRKKQAQKIAEENESLAKRIIHQPPTLKRGKINKDLINYLECRFQMQRFKNYFAEPPKKRKFKKRKIILSPINPNQDWPKDNSLVTHLNDETLKTEDKPKENIEAEKKSEIGETIKENTQNPSEIKESVPNENTKKDNEMFHLMRKPENEIKKDEQKNVENKPENLEVKPKNLELKPEETKKENEQKVIPITTNENLQFSEKEEKKLEEKNATTVIDESNINLSKNSGLLIITPKNAEILKTGELSNEMQTLVRIKLWDQTVRTKVSMNKGKTPIWNQNLVVSRHTQSKNKNLAIVELWQNDEWNANKLLGSNVLNIDELEVFGEKKKTSRWIEMKQDEDQKIIGRVLVHFEWKLQEKKVGNSKNSEREDKILQAKERQAKSSHNKEIITNSKKSGLLIVRPKQAEMLPEYTLSNEMDAYVKAILGKEVAQGQFSMLKGEKLQWIQSLSLKRKASEVELRIELWYKDNFAGNDLKGSIDIDLLKTTIFLDKKTELWFEIIDQDKVLGKMLIEFEWKVVSIQKKLK